MFALNRSTPLSTARIWPTIHHIFEWCRKGCKWVYTGSHIQVFNWYQKWWFRMTLNGTMAVICITSPNSVALGANYITAVEVRPILSATKT